MQSYYFSVYKSPEVENSTQILFNITWLNSAICITGTVASNIALTFSQTLSLSPIPDSLPAKLNPEAECCFLYCPGVIPVCLLNILPK